MHFKEFAVLTKLVVLVLHLEFYYVKGKNFWKKYLKTQTSHCLYISHGRVATPRFSLEKRKFLKNASIRKEYFSFFFFRSVKIYRKIHSTTETKVTFSAI